MSIGKYISLEEVKDLKTLKRFVKAHPSTGDKTLFDDLLNRMAKNLPVGDQTSKKG